MKKNKLMKKLLAVVCCGMMLTGSLSGCGVAVSDEAKGSSTETENVQTESVQAENEQTENTESEVKQSETIVKYGTELANLDLDGTLHGQYEGQTLTIPVMSGDFEKAVSAVVPVFEQMSGAKVVIESIPGEQYTDKVQLDLNNTHRYDVVLSPIAILHGFAIAGKVEPLEEMINTYAGESYNVDDFLPGLFNTYGYYDGKLVAIPYKPDVMLLFYRKDLFEDEAVKAAYQEKYSTELKVPETNEEMIQVAQFFTKSENQDSPVDYGYCAMMLKGSTRLLFFNRGGDDIDENLNPNMNNAEGVAAMNRILELQKSAPKEWVQMGWDEANQFFANGNAAMMEQWPGLWLTCQADGSAVKDKVGVAVAPGKTPTLGGWGASIASESKNKELAWKFIEFMTSRDGELLKIENTMDPCRASTYEIPEVQASSELYEALMESFNYAKTLADVDVPYISSKLCDVMESYIQQAMDGSMTPEEALEGMEKEFTTEIGNLGLED